VADFVAAKKERNASKVRSALDDLARAAASKDENTFAAVVAAARAGVTHGEIVACLREELGFGHPLIAP
jgi:methylmalonyl-CoA mutase N-terminal domain/subunit